MAHQQLKHVPGVLVGVHVHRAPLIPCRQGPGLKSNVRHLHRLVVCVSGRYRSGSRNRFRSRKSSRFRFGFRFGFRYRFRFRSRFHTHWLAAPESTT
jgi:hypothetical protein